MDAELVVSAASLFVAVLVAWLDHRRRRRSRGGGERADEVIGLPVLEPRGRLPQVVRGRDRVLRQLWRWVRRPPGTVVVLAGTGGVGKSTVAAALAARARQSCRIRRVWWVSAADRAALVGGLVTVARELGASTADLRAIASGLPDAPDRLWALLRRAPGRWLLIFDNADEPAVLARPAPVGSAADEAAPGDLETVGDQTSWLRSTGRGLVLVTSRTASVDVWGRRHARVLRLAPLEVADAAGVLRDLAPQAGGLAEARQLADRLGGMPLAIWLCGSYLGSGLTLYTSFDDYRRALADPETGISVLSQTLTGATNSRTAVMRTWEISLDALAYAGVPQARSLLRLLSCYASATAVPRWLLDPATLADILQTRSPTGREPVMVEDSASPPTGASPGPAAQPGPVELARRLERGLAGLESVGLLHALPGDAAFDGVGALIVQPVVAATNQAHLAADPTTAGRVRAAAVDLVTTALDRAHPTNPAWWPRYHLLGPHLNALLTTIALQLDQQRLHDLVEAAAATVRALGNSGAISAAYRLAGNAAGLCDENPAGLRLRHEQAWLLADHGRIADAEAQYRHVWERRRRILGADHPDALATAHELAWIAAVQGRWAEAEAGYRRILPTRLRVLGPDDRGTLVTRHELGWCVANQGRWPEAEELLRVVLDDRRRALGAEDPNSFDTEHELAWLAAKQHRLDEALAAYRRLVAVRRRLLGETHWKTLTTRHELAWTSALRGEQRAALREYRRVLEIRERVRGGEHRDTVLTRRAIELLRENVILPAWHVA